MGGRIFNFILMFLLVIASVNAITYVVYDDPVETVEEPTYEVEESTQRQWKSTNSNNYIDQPDYDLLSSHLSKVRRSEYYDRDYDDYRGYYSYQGYYDGDYYDRYRYDRFPYDERWYVDYYDYQRYKDKEYDDNGRYRDNRYHRYYDNYYNNRYYDYYRYDDRYKYDRFALHYDGDYLDYLLYKIHKRCSEECNEKYDPINDDYYDTCSKSCKRYY
tara:strand:+ start:2214 stop:2861 length:648 start_codon:yes stop_codon:yes gene_type:complete